MMKLGQKFLPVVLAGAVVSGCDQNFSYKDGPCPEEYSKLPAKVCFEPGSIEKIEAQLVNIKSASVERQNNAILVKDGEDVNENKITFSGQINDKEIACIVNYNLNSNSAGINASNMTETFKRLQRQHAAFDPSECIDVATGSAYIPEIKPELEQFP